MLSGVRKAGREGGRREESVEPEIPKRKKERGREKEGREERALGFREYYLVSTDNDTSASFYSPHQL